MANIVRMRDLPRKIGLSRSTIYQMIRNGDFPEPFRIVKGGRACGWLDSTIDQWATERSRKGDKQK